MVGIGSPQAIVGLSAVMTRVGKILTVAVALTDGRSEP